MCAQSNATRKHDTVWALLGISGGLAVPGLEPTYDIPEMELYPRGQVKIHRAGNCEI